MWFFNKRGGPPPGTPSALKRPFMRAGGAVLSLEQAFHLVALGGTGSGKSSIMRELLSRILAGERHPDRHGRIGAVFAAVRQDVAGDVQEIAARAGRLGDVVRIDESCVINPLADYMYLAGPDFQVETLVGMIMEAARLSRRSSGGGDSSQEFFESRGKAYLRAVLQALYSGDGHVSWHLIARCLREVPRTREEAASRLWKESTFLGRAILGACGRCPADLRRGEEDDIATMIRFVTMEAPDEPTKQREGAVAVIMNVCAPFLLGAMSLMTNGRSSVTPRMAFDDGKILDFSPVSIARWGDAARILQSLFLANFFRQAQLRAVGPETPLTLVVADEFQQVVLGGDIWCDALPILRSQKVGCYCATQTIGGLARALGSGPDADRNAHLLLSQFANKVVCSSTDPDLSGWVNGLAGRTHVLRGNSSFSDPDGEWLSSKPPSRNVGVSEQLDLAFDAQAVLPGLKRGGYANNGIIEAFWFLNGMTWPCSGTHYHLARFQQRLT